MIPIAVNLNYCAVLSSGEVHVVADVSHAELLNKLLGAVPLWLLQLSVEVVSEEHLAFFRTWAVHGLLHGFLDWFLHRGGFGSNIVLTHVVFTNTATVIATLAFTL